MSVTLSYSPDEVGNELPPEAVLWPTPDKFQDAFYKAGSNDFQADRHMYREAHRRWQQTKVDLLFAPCPIGSFPNKPLYMYKVDSLGRVVSRMRFQTTHSVFGLAELSDNGTRIWPSELFGSTHPKDSSVIVNGVKIKGTVVARLVTTFDDWTQTLLLDSFVDSIAYAPSEHRGWSKHFTPDAPVPALWIETATLYPRLENQKSIV